MGLLDLFRNIPTPNEMTGSLGEWMAKIYMNTYDGVLVLHDVLIKISEENTSQIDLIIIGDRGIFVGEVKLYQGAKIYGDVKKSQWSYYKNGRKYEIYSPIKQNARHIEYLKAFLSDFGEIPYFSVVTMFCEDFKVSGEPDGKTLLCNTLPSMDRGLKLLASKNPVVFDDTKKQEIYEFIKNNQIAGKDARAEHKNNVASYKNSIDELKEQKICPYCRSELVLRNGKYGEFYGCKAYPKCRYIQKK